MGVNMNSVQRLATIAPADVLGIDCWKVGARADLLLFHWAPGDASIVPSTVLIAGEQYDRRAMRT